MGILYNQLTLDERYQIQALNELNYLARVISKKLHRSNKTIAQELQRGSLGSYCAKEADETYGR